jgi:hypothetical protein
MLKDHLGRLVLVDQNRAFNLWMQVEGHARSGLPLEIVRRLSHSSKGFVVLPKRCTVERTLAWLGRCRKSGGAGFVGSHLCERLLDRGDEVLCVDNYFSSTRHNVEHLLDNRRMELMRHDVTFPLYVEVDEIFNLACPASPVYYQFDPV